jgi:sn-glycerol 3-phosphate transport system permease protein
MKTWKIAFGDGAVLLLGTLCGCVVVFPIFYATALSFMSGAEIFAYPPKLVPSTLRLDAYRQAFRAAPLLRFIFNSMLVSSLITFGQIMVCSIAAYAFAFFEFRGKKLLFVAALSTMMIPQEVTIMANYLTIAELGWIDSYMALVVPFIASAMGIFLMRQYYLTLPRELKEASVIDGCGDTMFYLKVVLPLTQPAAASLGIYTFLRSWNQFLWPLLVTNNEKFRTVQIGIQYLASSEGGSDYSIVMAGVVVILIPSIGMYLAGQRKLIGGMTAGAIKG